MGEQARLSFDEPCPPLLALLVGAQPFVFIGSPAHQVGIDAPQEGMQPRPVEPAVVVHPAPVLRGSAAAVEVRSSCLCSSEADRENVSGRDRCGATSWRGVSPVFGRGVELGHELAVGGPGGGEIFVLFLELQTQVDGLLFQVDDLLVEGVDVGGRTESGFAPGLLAEGFGQAFLKLADSAVEPGGTFPGGKQVGLQGCPGNARSVAVAGSGWGGFESVELGEQVAVPVEKCAIHAGGAGDARHADLGAVRDGLAEGCDDALAAAGRVGLAAFGYRAGARVRRPGQRAVRDGGAGAHARDSIRGEGSGARKAGMPRLTGLQTLRWRRTTATASSTAARSSSVSWVMSPLILLISRRMRVISSSAGVASGRARSSTPSTVAARRSRVRSRSSR